MYDRTGVDLIRLSTEVQADYSLWLDALERAGCIRKTEDGAFSPRPSNTSPTPSNVSDTTDTATSTQPSRPGGTSWKSAEVDSAAVQLERMKRQQSGYTSDASDVGPRPPRRRKGPPEACTPAHMHPRSSLLSSERITLTNQSGLLTLCFIVLAATNFRLILENMMKYGLRFNPFTFLRAALTPSGNLWLLLCWPYLLLTGLVALGIERTAAMWLEADFSAYANMLKKQDGEDEPSRRTKELIEFLVKRSKVAEPIILILNLINTSAELIGPCWVIYKTVAEPLPAFALTMAASVLWLKLVSFAHVNGSLRNHRRKHPKSPCPGETNSGTEPEAIEDDIVQYPLNLKIGNILYFLAAPTLCYQLSYPRSPRVRLRWMLRRIAMFSGALGLMLFFFEQYIEPTIDNSLKPLQEMDWLRMAERVLKLSIPTLYFWLAMFLALFDLWLNILAEATRFGDREFYKDWWNATTLGEYWRLWNMPVHKWMVRHVYFPALHAGVPKFAAGVIVFFVSAVFHELLVGVPLHMVRGWAFWGIMAQVPLMWVTEVMKNKFKNDRMGNVIFWTSFCFLGQPLAEILYFHDWRKKQLAGGL